MRAMTMRRRTLLRGLIGASAVGVGLPLFVHVIVTVPPPLGLVSVLPVTVAVHATVGVTSA